MDRLIYIAMTGAMHTMGQQSTVAHNLANISTAGFKGEFNSFRALQVYGDGSPTRAFVVDSTTGADFTPGVIQQTGRDLDVAVHGKGWIAVQALDGSEAYTRNGSLQINANGILQTRDGLNVLGDSGPISIPPDSEISVAKDGTVSTVPIGQATGVTTVGRIKLVNPPDTDIVKSGDGLIRLKNGTVAPADADVMLAGSALEGSNVNAADALVKMISLARQFDMQMKVVQTEEGNAAKSSQILNMTA